LSKTDVLIIGAGISGLSLAWWLSRQGLSVEIWEADKRIGGKIQTHQSEDGYLTERAAAMVMNFRPEVTELLNETGLDSAKISRQAGAEARRYLLHNGKLTALPMRMGAMVFSPLWSLRGKLRLLAEPFIPPFYNRDESVSRFISRRLGREMLEKTMEPFVAGTLAADPEKASAEACLPRLTALERKYGSITAGVLINRLLRRTACGVESFSFRGGMATLVETLARTPGVQIATSYQVNEITQTSKGWKINASTPDGERTLEVPKVVLTVPAPHAAKLVSPLDNELASLLRGIQYAPVNIVHTGFSRAAIDHALDGTGFLVPRYEAKGSHQALTGNLWMSSLFPKRAPQDKVLLSSFIGGARMPEVQDWNTERCITNTMASLAKFLDLKTDPEFVRIDRHTQALPLYYGSYLARMQTIANRLQQMPGLYLEANYRGGVSVRDRIARSRTVAKKIIATLPEPDLAEQISGIGAKLVV